MTSQGLVVQVTYTRCAIVKRWNLNMITMVIDELYGWAVTYFLFQYECKRQLQ